MTAERGITNLIRACAIAGARLHLAGPVWPAYLEELKKMPEFACVDYAGVVPYAGVPEYCRHFSVGCATLLNIHQYVCTDNLPTKVCSKGTYIRTLLEEIAAAIRSLLDDPERRAAMGERGYGALQTRFNWQTEEKKLLALYEELLSLKGE